MTQPRPSPYIWLLYGRRRRHCCLFPATTTSLNFFLLLLLKKSSKERGTGIEETLIIYSSSLFLSVFPPFSTLSLAVSRSFSYQHPTRRFLFPAGMRSRGSLDSFALQPPCQPIPSTKQTTHEKRISVFFSLRFSRGAGGLS